MVGSHACRPDCPTRAARGRPWRGGTQWGHAMDRRAAGLYPAPCWCAAKRPRRRRDAMPEFPGVFAEEVSAGARPIEGVGTSTAAFVGAMPSGPVGAPLMGHSFAEYEAQFGALAVE